MAPLPLFILLLLGSTSCVNAFVSVTPSVARSETIIASASLTPSSSLLLLRQKSRARKATTTTTTSLNFMGALSDDTLLTHRPIRDISWAFETWFPNNVVLPKWMPRNNTTGSVAKYGIMTTYICLGMALVRLSLLGMTATTTVPFLWMIHLLGTTTSAQVGFGMQRLRPAMIIQSCLLCTMPLILWKLATYDLAAFYFLLPYTGWLTFVVVFLHQLCRLNPTTTSEP